MSAKCRLEVTRGQKSWNTWRQLSDKISLEVTRGPVKWKTFLWTNHKISNVDIIERCQIIKFFDHIWPLMTSRLTFFESKHQNLTSLKLCSRIFDLLWPEDDILLKGIVKSLIFINFEIRHRMAQNLKFDPKIVSKNRLRRIHFKCNEKIDSFYYKIFIWKKFQRTKISNIF